MLPEERHRAIRDRLSSAGRVLALDLARELGASEDTIRRDLRELAGLGLCRRVYGGALPVSRASGSLETRRRQDPDRKAALGRVAATLVEPGQLVFLDAGSTNLAIAHALADHAHLTIATNAPSIAMALAGRPGVSLLMIGGLIDPQVGGALGARAIRDVRLLSVDLCFLGACALSDSLGVRAFLFEDAEFKRSLAESSRVIAVAATTEKLGTTAPFQVVPSAGVNHLIVEKDAPSECLETFSRTGTRIHRASGEAAASIQDR